MFVICTLLAQVVLTVRLKPPYVIKKLRTDP